MKLATAAQMREIDKLAIEQYQLPGVVLMENAGSAVAREVERLLTGLKDKKICVFAGLGNNGGDGFVAARYLVNSGAKV
ncbi:MAG TPA: bifunctional ADP-dependent NAD(P)H-hydrate dehydratase/NAD(P)H-hydrate epimerase, partial [Sporomusaceae bacterium]|nr:bifunctional ADP-dependent NAD(P)H-hydrate dehydratase/NAD(P)H-hydrate epimerase [Sporomusaceae bacterium]